MFADQGADFAEKISVNLRINLRNLREKIKLSPTHKPPLFFIYRFLPNLSVHW